MQSVSGCHMGTVYNGRRLQFLPSKGGGVMEQYVTYDALFAFVLVLTAVAQVVIALYAANNKKK